MATKSVSIQDFFFDPEDTRISKGDTVQWTNEGSSRHTVTAPGLFDKVLEPGEAFTHEFPEAGTVNYHCRFHSVSHQMKGTVTVS